MHHSSLSHHPSSFQMCPPDRPVTHARGYALAQLSIAAGAVLLLILAPIYLYRAFRWLFGPLS